MVIDGDSLAKICLLLNNDCSDNGTPTLISIIHTCKSWNNIIQNINQNNKPVLFRLLWESLVHKYMSKNASWKKFQLLPDKYRSVIYSLDSKFIDIEFESGSQENIFLMSIILSICPNIAEVKLEFHELSDAFVYGLSLIGKWITKLTFVYDFPDDEHIEQLFINNKEPREVLPKLNTLELQFIDWDYWNIDKSAFFQHFGNQIQHISFESDTKIKNLSNVCPNLKSFEAKGDLFCDFYSLAQLQNVEEIRIDFNDDESDFEFYELFMNKNICPKLKLLHFRSYYENDVKNEELKQARKDVDIAPVIHDT